MKNILVTVCTILICQSLIGQSDFNFKHVNLKTSLNALIIDSLHFGFSVEGSFHFNFITNRERSINFGYAKGDEYFSLFKPANTFKTYFISYNQYYNLNPNLKNSKFERLLKIGLRFNYAHKTTYLYDRDLNPRIIAGGNLSNYKEISTSIIEPVLSLHYILRRNFSSKFGYSFNLGCDLGYVHSSIEIGIGLHFL